ncbi:MAG: histidine triad nucleotide-binding protein [Bdellovibrionales bacterium RIFOXYB1_FULL_37_110]|nr:MAG: histidine triad nucleotide-binding protein [Bdellovibrionales bacterium RIFOXYA1_FULL_38_20]OFZ51637.1 MAG: histidine triad nucleotide-binding protein [Bdellovibrionales bacterium RIFOXYC1_FULL_37_79]OFZ60464.1 MAG: histidine triad nucleotide-binding protein [Bdellovibrionales bacterium RIFOXYB1_FULL_37_110]OFZ65037.1 MAG: histidine triad nucleotide-binding protein [Bdellovibrionales bacterium RIFOXYD1_FULL_36_51]
MTDCIFCKIIDGKIPAEIIFENEDVLAFRDIQSQAREHFLFIHKTHQKDLVEMVHENPDGLLQIMKAISEFSNKTKLKENGFRVVTNVGRNAGQSVFHTHFHVLSDNHLGKFGK